MIQLYAIYKRHTLDSKRCKEKDEKNIYHANKNKERAGVATLIWDKIHLKTKRATRDKEGYFIMIKGLIY